MFTDKVSYVFAIAFAIYFGIQGIHLLFDQNWFLAVGALTLAAWETYSVPRIGKRIDNYERTTVLSLTKTDDE